MYEPPYYCFVPTENITAYQLAQIIAVGTFWVTKENYDKLPPDVQSFLTLDAPQTP